MDSASEFLAQFIDCRSWTDFDFGTDRSMALAEIMFRQVEWFVSASIKLLYKVSTLIFESRPGQAARYVVTLPHK